MLCKLLLLLEGILQVLGGREELYEFEALEEVVTSSKTHRFDFLATFEELVGWLG